MSTRAAKAAAKARAAKIMRTSDSIRTRFGRKINWSKPPKPSAIVQWHHRGRVYKCSFRAACHMARLNNLSRKKFGVEIVVIQPAYNTGVKASQGTHDFDATWDVYIPGVSWFAQQSFFRTNGFACWYRYPPKFGHHIHGFTLPVREGKSISDDFKVGGFKVGRYVDGGYSTLGYLATSSQIDDYYRHAHGLAGMHTTNSDKSWYPKDIEKTIFNHPAFIKRRVNDAARAKKVLSRV